MNGLKVPLATRLKVALRGIGRTIVQPLPALTMLLTAFLTVSLFVWVPNIGLLFELGKLPSISYADKLKIFFEGFEALVLNFSELQAAAIVLTALLIGLNVALILAVGISRKNSLGSGGSLLLAIFGAGCAACGTSILAPLLATLVVATSVAAVEVIGITAQILAITLLTYSAYKLGLQTASTA